MGFFFRMRLILFSTKMHMVKVNSPDPKSHANYCHHLASVVNISYFNLLLLKHLVNCKHTLREWMMYEESSKLVPHFVLIG